MTRSQSEYNILKFDPEIERTLRVLRKTKRTLSNLNLCVENFSTSSYSVISDHTTVSVNMANPDRTLKELAAPDVAYQPLCIQYPDLDVDFELKSGLIHLLPKFHGLAGEDPISI